MLGDVLEDFVWDIVWSFNWDWFVDYERFLANAGDWSVVGNGSLKSSWDGNVEVSKDWLDDGGVISSNVWASSVFDLLGYYWWWLVNRDSIWSRNMLGGVWSWDADGYSWGGSNTSISDSGKTESGSWGSGVAESSNSWGSSSPSSFWFRYWGSHGG